MVLCRKMMTKEESEVDITPTLGFDVRQTAQKKKRFTGVWLWLPYRVDDNPATIKEVIFLYVNESAIAAGFSLRIQDYDKKTGRLSLVCSCWKRPIKRRIAGFA